jgi:hypothetical protein
MSCLKSVFVFAAAMVGVATSALGGVAGSISVTVAPILSPAVATYTDPRTGFNGTVGYQVDVRNVLNNTSNNVLFTAKAAVTDPAELATLEFLPPEGVACTAIKGTTDIAINCAIGTLNSGQSFPTFYLFFKTPEFVPNGTADSGGTNPVPNGTDYVTVSHQTFFAEGDKGGRPKNGFTANVFADPTLLGTPDPTLVRSVVLASGGTFFTGNQGIADAIALDIHATKTVVPPLTKHTTAEIVETAVSGSVTSPCTGNVFTCYTSQITIPGTFNAPPYLTTRLSQAIQNIRKQTVTVTVPCYDDHDDDDRYRTSSTYTYSYPRTCTKTKTQLVPIEQVVIKYLADVTLANPNPIEQTVGLCSPLAGPPPVGVPCITNRTVVNDLSGKPIRYEWTFISFNNGRLAIN